MWRVSDVTRILERVEQDDNKAAEELLPLRFPDFAVDVTDSEVAK